MRERNRKNLKKWLRKKPIWFTVVCATAAIMALVGIGWIMRDTYVYQNTLKTVDGSFERYEVITDRYWVSTGIRTSKQGNLYLDGKKYVIASDSLSAFDQTGFDSRVAVGDRITIQVTDDDVVYSIKDSDGTSYLSLSEAQANSRNDNQTGIVLCISMLVVLGVAWCFYEKG